MAPKFACDAGANAAWIRFSPEAVAESEEGSERVVLDYDRLGRIVGMEVLGASRPVSRVLYGPGPARGPERGGHSSGTDVAVRLARPTRMAGAERSRGFPLPSLFGLAPGGVCRAAPVARGAVGSCPTLSPLPGRPRGCAGQPGGRRAVCFLWHFPWGRPRRPFAGTVFRGARTFLADSLSARVGAAARPAGTRSDRPEGGPGSTPRPGVSRGAA
jgi:uncharacterized protein YuzE